MALPHGAFRSRFPIDVAVLRASHLRLYGEVDTGLTGLAPTPNRHARLARSRDLPCGLGLSAVRAQIAAGLDAARLYWIDPEFTDLTTHAAAALPATTVSAADAPAPRRLPL